MRTKKQATFLISVILGAVMMLSACGISAGASSTPPTAGTSSNSPDSVRIEIDAFSPGIPPGTKPMLTLSDGALVRQLYATIFALPALPANRACTDELGPHYTLTFRYHSTTLASVQADRDGCRPVTIIGKTPVRQGTSAFWQQLDQAIFTATPPLSPDRLAIAFTSQSGKAPQTALITSAATARQFYDAILALPLASAAQACSDELLPTYQFVFFAGEQTAPASINDSCQTVIVEGGYQSRGGAFAMNDQFRSLLRSLLAGATFAPARPDQLALSVAKGHTTSDQPNVSDTQLMLALYDYIFTLPETAFQPGCPPDADKLAGKGTYAMFTFTQWSLPLVQIATYEGSCTFVQIATTGQRLRADQSFWDLVHRALAE